MPKPGGIHRDVPENASVKEILGLASIGSLSFSKAVAALSRKRCLRFELSTCDLDTSAARVVDEYLASPGCNVREIVFKRVAFSGPDAFSRVCNGISQNKSIEHITITQSSLSDVQADKLATALTCAAMNGAPVSTINLSSNSLACPTDCVAKLKRLTKLDRLVLDDNRLICTHVLAGAISAYWPALKELSLVRTGITGADAEALQEAASRGTSTFAEYSAPRSVLL